jgi:Mg-chelatase subunit ChlD
MARDDQAARDLDAAFDALLAARPAPSQGPSKEQFAMAQHLHELALRATPDPTFVRSLEASLLRLHARSAAALGESSARRQAATPSAAGWRHGDDQATRPWSRTARRWQPAVLAVLVVGLILVGIAFGGREKGPPAMIPAGDVASPPATTRAVLLIMDKSGSMSYDPLGGTSKIEMAKEAVRVAAQSLADGDVVGILVFNDEQQWVLQMTTIEGPETRAQIDAAVDTITADGGTEIYPALTAGLAAIRSVEADVRQIVLLSDGKSRTGTRESYQRLIEDAAGEGITISTVAIGDDADTSLLQFIAEQGGGSYFLAERPEDIMRGVQAGLGLPNATPAPTTDQQDAIRSSPVTVAITVDDAGLLRGEAAAEEDAIRQLEAAMVPFMGGGCRIGFVITEGSAPDVATGNQLADAVNALLQRAFPDLVAGAGFYSFANLGDANGRINLLLFPNTNCEEG